VRQPCQKTTKRWERLLGLLLIIETLNDRMRDEEIDRTTDKGVRCQARIQQQQSEKFEVGDRFESQRFVDLLQTKRATD
jgi:hypothetical protein